MTAEDLNRVVIHCKGLLFDKQDRLLLVRQAESIGTYWNAPGGRMDGDDTPDSCLRREVRGKYSFENMIGDSARMRALYDLIGRVARSNVLAIARSTCFPRSSA